MDKEECSHQHTAHLFLIKSSVTFTKQYSGFIVQYIGHLAIATGPVSMGEAHRVHSSCARAHLCPGA